MKNNNTEQSFEQRLLKFREENRKKREEANLKKGPEIPNAGFERFIEENPRIFEYLNNSFNHYHSINLIYYSLLGLKTKYTKFSMNDYRDILTDIFSYDDQDLFLKNISGYLDHKFKNAEIKAKVNTRNALQEKVVTDSEFQIITEYAVCIIYNNLRIYEYFISSYEYVTTSSHLSNTYNFYPLAINICALNQYYRFIGVVKSITKKTNDNGDQIAIIKIQDEDKLFIAIVQPENYNKVLKGLNYMNNSDIWLWGKPIRDPSSSEIILELERFFIYKRDNYHFYNGDSF